ncbi:MAG: hypothetical protein SFV22_01810, partial [Saprospiraceae bacterium]|nr:hypothetical protein [Saprospiraceae bacterium]
SKGDAGRLGLTPRPKLIIYMISIIKTRRSVAKPAASPFEGGRGDDHAETQCPATQAAEQVLP